jgi:vacuolar iron transporter family protein
MMRFELGLEKPQPGRAVRSAGTIAFSYIAGGLIPLTPYLITPHALVALGYSVGATILALAIFGFVKGHYTGVSPWTSAFRTTLIGGLAAGAAFSIAKLFST